MNSLSLITFLEMHAVFSVTFVKNFNNNYQNHHRQCIKIFFKIHSMILCEHMSILLFKYLNENVLARTEFLIAFFTNACHNFGRVCDLLSGTGNWKQNFAQLINLVLLLLLI
jgi:hypothetical protein